MAKFRTRFVMIVVACFVLLAGCRRKDSSEDPSQPSSVVLPHVVGTKRTGSELLFEKLDAKSIGISFRHEWKPKSKYEAQLLKTGFTGGGVCMGDFDSDGLCDVYLTRPHGGGRLFRNTGDFQFEDVTDAAGVNRATDWCTGATFVDVDNDSDLDLCVNAYDSANRLFVNNGDGTFTESHACGLNFSGASIKTIFADYDNDGDLDAFLVTNRLEPRSEVKIRYLGSPGNYRVAPEHRELAMAIDLPSGEQKFAKAGQFDRLYKNELSETGKLQFRDVTSNAKLTGNFHGLDATWWDYDHDGDPDLYVANDFTDPDQWLRNNGDGTFTDVTRQTVPNTPWFAMGSAFGDLNNDGLLDLIATDMSGTTHYREKIAMGSMEAVAWFLDTAEPRQYMRNALYVNTGTDRFIELAHLSGLSSSDWTWSVKIADLDNDGLEDIYVTNGFTRDYLNGDFNEQLKRQGTASKPMAWYEAPELKEKNIAFRNNGDLHFENESQSWGLDELSICFGAAFGDLDNDGDIDLITNNFDGPPSVYRNGSTQNSVTVSLVGTKSNAMGVGAFVTARVAEDTVVRYFNHANGYLSSNQPVLHFGIGNASKVSELEIKWPSGTVQRLGELDANQHIAVREPAVANPEKLSQENSNPIFERQELPDVRHVERAYDDFERQPLLPNRMSQYGPGIAVSDINGDGVQDFFLAGAAGAAGQVWLGTSEENLPYKQLEVRDLLQHVECEDMGCLWIDLDNDNDLDLYVVSGGVEVDDAESELLRDRVYLNRLSETTELRFDYAPDALPDVRSSGSIAAAADFDRDGDLDVFVGGRCIPHAFPMSPSSQILRNNNGKLTDATAEVAPELVGIGMVTSAIWSDIDSDGWIDLLLTFDYGPIRVFKNSNGSLTDTSIESGTESLTGWWNSIVAADVDSDGDMDYAVGNLGHNSKYHPRPEKPQHIYYGDFDESGKMHIVEAKPGTDGLLPVRGRSCSSNAMPFLQQKFGTYHDFAMSSLEDIYSNKCLDESLKLSVTTTDSGVLINDGTGKFRFDAFPTLAQTSPIFGMQFVHLNQDRHPDLVAVQNFDGPQRETGRMNGGVGVVLLGHGDGSFAVERSDSSGLVIPEDAMGLVTVPNGRGAIDLITSVNDGKAIKLIDISPARTMRLHILGNQSELAGAQIELVFADGARQLCELSAGSGYLSQVSANVLTVGFDELVPPIQCEIRLPGRAAVFQELNSDKSSEEIHVSSSIE